MTAAALISPLFLLSGIGMMLVAVGGVWWWQRGKTSLWPAVWWGVFAWTLSVAIKFLAAWPGNSLVQRHTGEPVIWLYAGLLTGVFECAIPLVLILGSRLRRADWDRAVAFGLGFGGIEAFLLGLGSLVPVAMLVAFPEQVPASVRDVLIPRLQQSGLISIPLPIVERASALAIHVCSAVLLIYSVRMRQQRWFWVAFVYKTAVDGVAAWAVLTWRVTESTGKIAGLELAMACFGAIACWALPHLKVGFGRQDAKEAGLLVSLRTRPDLAAS